MGSAGHEQSFKFEVLSLKFGLMVWETLMDEWLSYEVLRLTI
jgi:hypothetical protein